MSGWDLRRPARARRRVLDMGDVRAEVAFGGLAYAGRALDASGRGEPFLSVSIGGEFRHEPDIQRLTVPIERTALDDRGVIARPRPSPVPAGSALVDDLLVAPRRGHSWPTTQPTFDEWCRTLERLEVRYVSLGRSGGVDALSQAQAIVHLAASGFLVSAEDDGHPALGFLDPHLAAEVTTPLGAAVDDDLEWAAAAARQGRAAWLGHQLELRWSPDGVVSISTRRIPTLSVVLVSRRPDLIPDALHRISKQVGLVPEVIIGIHHDSRDAVDLASETLTRSGLSGEVVRLEPSIPFGAAFNLAVERSTGQIITKWDDDDLYGPHHLEDLVVALWRSGADLVGKAAEFVVFTDLDETAHRAFKGAERESTFVAGGTLTTTRAAFDAVGGFPPVQRFIDHHLKERYLEAGRRVYRTHGFGFALVRGRADHTWGATTADLRKTGDRFFVGVPGIIGLGEDG